MTTTSAGSTSADSARARSVWVSIVVPVLDDAMTVAFAKSVAATVSGLVVSRTSRPEPGRAPA